MTDSVVTVPNRAWSRAPWRVEVQSTSQARAWQWGVHHADVDREEALHHDIVAWEIENEPDARLIQMSPEMAEAIIAWFDAPKTGDAAKRAEDLLWAAASKLDVFADAKQTETFA